MAAPISIIVPTRNAGSGFADTLEAIRNQRPCAAQIVVVDSGSTDGTPEVAARHGAAVLRIPPSQYNHGATRNLAIEHCNGEVCVLLAQDAVPADDHWLQLLTEPFADPGIAGVSGGQTPRPEADAFALYWRQQRVRLLGENTRTLSIESWSEFCSLTAEERYRRAVFNNVNSAIRRSAWEQAPFRRLPFAEDLDWAVRTLRAGYRLIYRPEAAVVHSHSRPPRYVLRRGYLRAKTVPGLLCAAIEAPEPRNDKEVELEVRRQIEICRSLIRSSHSDWNSLLQRRLGPVQAGGDAVTAANAPRTQAARANGCCPFLATAAEVAAWDRAPCAFSVRRALELALAHSLGSMLGAYYLWRLREGAVSERLHRLDARLSHGI